MQSGSMLSMGRPAISLVEKLDRQSIPEPNSGCLLWLGGVDKDGYGVTSLHGKNFRVHRASWQIEYGSIPDNLAVLHRCDVACCLNPKHLFLGTQAVNMADMVTKSRQANGARHGRTTKPERTARGTRHWAARLTDSDVAAIRIDPRQHRAIGAEYGISHTAVGFIKRRKTWQHIP